MAACLPGECASIGAGIADPSKATIGFRSPTIDAHNDVSPGPRLIVTRPLAQATPWVERLRALGCDAQALPLIQIAAVADTGPLRQRWRVLSGADTGVNTNAGTQLPRLVMFVSANAVQHFFAAAPGQHLGWPAGTLAGATGPGTTAALLQAGVTATSIVEPAADAPMLDSEALWQQLQRRQADWQGQRVWVVRGGPGPNGEGRDWFAQTLTEHGAVVEPISAYRRCAPSLDAAGQTLLDQALRWPQQHVWVFSSSDAVTRLLELAARATPHGPQGPDGASHRWHNSRAWAPHPRIVQAARQAGFGQVQQVGTTPEALAQQWLGL